MKYCNVTDPAKLKDEAVRFEEAIVNSSRADGRKGIVALPGVRSIIDELLPAKGFPHPRWAICTSATRAYASAALEIARIDIPDVFVAAEDVKKGKPSPDPYLLGASLCGVEPSKCLVIEDAPAGVRSGLAAGCKVVGLLTTHSRQQMEESQPHLLVPDLSRYVKGPSLLHPTSRQIGQRDGEVIRRWCQRFGSAGSKWFKLDSLCCYV